MKKKNIAVVVLDIICLVFTFTINVPAAFSLFSMGFIEDIIGGLVVLVMAISFVRFLIKDIILQTRKR